MTKVKTKPVELEWSAEDERENDEAAIALTEDCGCSQRWCEHTLAAARSLRAMRERGRRDYLDTQPKRVQDELTESERQRAQRALDDAAESARALADDLRSVCRRLERP